MYDIAIQLNSMAVMEKSFAMEGRAMFTDEAMVVVRNEDKVVTNSATFFEISFLPSFASMGC